LNANISTCNSELSPAKICTCQEAR